MAIASLVLGILSLLAGLVLPGWQWIGGICGVIGIILGALAKKKGQGGMATAGLVMSIIGTILCWALYIACVACVAAAGSALGM